MNEDMLCSHLCDACSFRFKGSIGCSLPYINLGIEPYQKVTHSSFGVGFVTYIYGTRVTVDFCHVGLKTLDMGFTTLLISQERKYWRDNIPTTGQIVRWSTDQKGTVVSINDSLVTLQFDGAINKTIDLRYSDLEIVPPSIESRSQLASAIARYDINELSDLLADYLRREPIDLCISDVALWNDDILAGGVIVTRDKYGIVGPAMRKLYNLFCFVLLHMSGYRFEDHWVDCTEEIPTQYAIALAECLIKLGVDVNAVVIKPPRVGGNEEGTWKEPALRMPFLAAFALSDPSPSVAVIEFLIKHGADINTNVEIGYTEVSSYIQVYSRKFGLLWGEDGDTRFPRERSMGEFLYVCGRKKIAEYIWAQKDR